MPLAQRRATVTWEGNLIQGSGVLNVGTGAIADQQVTWAARTERPDGKTSPEELIAAAQAACYAMSLSATLARRDTPPARLDVTAVCSLERADGGIRISAIDLDVRGRVPHISEAEFEEAARQAEQGCPVANALRGNVDIKVKARLEG